MQSRFALGSLPVCTALLACTAFEHQADACSPIAPARGYVTDLTVTTALIDQGQKACNFNAACGIATRFWDVARVLQVRAIVADSPNSARQDTYVDGRKGAKHILRNSQGVILEESVSTVGSATFHHLGATVCVRTGLPPVDADGGSSDSGNADASTDDAGLTEDSGTGIPEVCVSVPSTSLDVTSQDVADHITDLRTTCPGGPHHLDEGLIDRHVQADPESSGGCSVGVPFAGASSLACAALGGVLIVALRRRRAARV